MRLYSTTGATHVDDPVYGSFDAGPRGEFDFPNGLSDQLHSMHVGKKAQWETDDERVKRVAEEELASVRDPATLLAAVKDMGANQSLLTQVLAKALGLDTTAVAPAPAASAPTAQPLASMGDENSDPEDVEPDQALTPEQVPAAEPSAKTGRRGKGAPSAA